MKTAEAVQVGTSANALRLQARELAVAALHEEAIETYREWQVLEPQNPEPGWSIADRLINMGRVDEAIQTYGRVLAGTPDCADARVGLQYARDLKRRAITQDVPYVPLSTESPDLSPANNARIDVQYDRFFRQVNGASHTPHLIGRRILTEAQRANEQLNQLEYSQGRVRLRSRPVFVYLVTSTKCNLRCRICPNAYEAPESGEILAEVLETARRELMPYAVDLGLAGRGEPTMGSRFDEVLDTGLAAGLRFFAITNATFLTFERIEKLVRSPNDICFSIDGATAATFERIREGSDFARFCEKLAMVKKLRDIYLSHDFTVLEFNFCALRQNIEEIPDVVRLAKRYGIDRVTISDYTPIGREFDQQAPEHEPERANRAFRRAREIANQLGVDLQTPAPFPLTPPAGRHAPVWQKFLRTRRWFSLPGRLPQRCSSTWTQVFIHADGQVSPCCAATNVKWGRIPDQDFTAIWNSWRYRLWRWRHRTSLPPVYCRKCRVWWGVTAGNPEASIAKEGRFVKIFYAIEAWLYQWLDRRAKMKWRP